MYRFTWIALCLLFAACILACGDVDSIDTTGTPKPNPADTAEPKEDLSKWGSGGEAAVVSEDIVKRHLKFPNNASFGWFPDRYLGDEVDGRRYWHVSGKVDAINAFGAEITHNYEVTLFLEDNTWQTMQVKIDGQPVEVNIAELAKVLEKRKVEEVEEREAEAEAKRQAFLNRKSEERRWMKEPRTWTIDGDPIEASFVTYIVGTVKLKTADGQTVEAQIKQLSEDDQAFIHKGLER